MGRLRPLVFVVAWAQPRIGERNPEAARPAIVLPKKDLLFMRSFMLVWILNPDAGVGELAYALINHGGTFAGRAWDVNAFPI